MKGFSLNSIFTNSAIFLHLPVASLHPLIQLEHKVVELEAQCESLTHKLNQCVSEGRGPVPSMQEFEAMQAENAYLRQENQELRRQFGGRPPYSAGGMPPPGLDDSKPGDGARFSGDYSSPRGYERVSQLFEL
jgi:hypothetical protein